MEKTRANRYKLPQKKFHLDIKKKIDLRPDQLPHGCGRVSITGGFQDATGQDARYSHANTLPSSYIGLDGLSRSLPTWATLWFYDILGGNDLSCNTI